MHKHMVTGLESRGFSSMFRGSLMSQLNITQLGFFSSPDICLVMCFMKSPIVGDINPNPNGFPPFNGNRNTHRSPRKKSCAKDLAPEVARHVLHHVSFSSRPSPSVSHQEILQLTGFFRDNLKPCRMMILLPAVVDFFFSDPGQGKL